MPEPFTADIYFTASGFEHREVASAPAMTAFLDELVSQPGGNRSASISISGRPRAESGYPDRRLMVGIDHEGNAGSLIYQGASSPTWVSRGSIDHPPFVRRGGQPLEFESNTCVPLDQVQAAMIEFLESGGQRPGCVEWREPAQPLPRKSSCEPVDGALEVYYKHEHGDDPIIITEPHEVDLLIGLLDGEVWEHSTAAIYVRERPPWEHKWEIHDELRVAVNHQTGVGGLRYMSQKGTWYAVGRESDRDDGVWYCYMGHDEDWPTDSEIPIDQVRTGVKEFLASGGERPESGQWKTWDEGMVGVGDPNASFLVPSADTDPADQ